MKRHLTALPRALAVAGILALTAAAPAQAQSTTRASIASGDRHFMEDAARGGLAEVRLGELAAQKATTPQVKQFGERMAADHGRAGATLKQIAATKGVDLPTDMDRASKREFEKLEKLSGADFDRAYMKGMVNDHQKDVKAFQKEAKSGKDEAVRNFAQATLPTLEQHLTRAKSTESAVRTAAR